MPHFFAPGRCLLGALLLAAALPGRAQTVNTVRFTVAGTGGRGPAATIMPAPGGWLVPGSIQFGTDSNCVSLLRFDPGLNITRARQYKLRVARTNYGPFVNTPSGLIFRGATSSADCLFSVDTAFNVRWGAQILPNIGIGILAPSGPGVIVGYPIVSVPSSTTGFTQVWGSAVTGTGWRGRRLNTTIQNWRITEALAPDASGIHYLTGDVNAPFIKLDTSRVYWSYLLDAGGADDRTGRTEVAANGDLWVAMQSLALPTGSLSSEIIVCRFDTAGTLRWGRQLAQANRFLGITDFYELPAGDLLVAGYYRSTPGGKLNPMLWRLTATGTLVWAHRWDVGSTGPLGGAPTILALPGGRFRLFNSDLSFVDLDANFNGCQFVDETPNTTSRAATITATPLPLTAAPLTVTSAPQALNTRTFTYARALVCSAVGLPEEGASAPLALWPQPLARGGTLHLELPTGWRGADIRLTLRSAVGQVVWQGPWAEALALPGHLPPGCWILTATGPAGRQLHRRLLLE